MINIIDINNAEERNEYESFVSSHKKGSFMQSLKWAEVKSGWDSTAVAVRDENGCIKGSALILIKHIPFIGKTFMYCPRGPVFSDADTFHELMDAVDVLAAHYRACTFKCDPLIMEDDSESAAVLESAGLRKREVSEDRLIQSKYNYVLNFNGRTKEELFKDFHKKWRYNIRVAQKHGVKCRVCGTEALDDFCKLMQETGGRDGYCVRDRSYFEHLMREMGDSAKLYMTYCGGMPLSGAVCVRYGGISSYVYGASTSHMRNVMPNYLMQWTMISDAADSGCCAHDFQGIPHYYDESHPNYGVYRFKSGFGGEVTGYVGEFDKVYEKGAAFLVRGAIFLRKLYLKAASHFSRGEKKEIPGKPLTFPQKMV